MSFLNVYVASAVTISVGACCAAALPESAIVALNQDSTQMLFLK